MRMVRTGLYFALGIKLVGVGGYMGMHERTCTSLVAAVSDLSGKRHSRVIVCCARLPGSPTDVQQVTSLRQNSRKAHHCQTKVRVVYLVKTRG
jgi:hypothetical protein